MSVNADLKINMFQSIRDFNIRYALTIKYITTPKETLQLL